MEINFDFQKVFLPVLLGCITATAIAQDSTPIEKRIYREIVPSYLQFYKTAKEAIEAGGEQFAPETAAFYNAEAKVLITSGTAAQLDLLEKYFAIEAKPKRRQAELFCIVDIVEVDFNEFSDWLFENRIESDATPLREEVQSWVNEGRGTVVETMLVAALSGHRARVESNKEVIYPTEITVGDMPNVVTLTGRAKAPITPASFSAYETRKVGTQLEIDPVLGSDGVTVDLALSPRTVTEGERSIWPTEEIDQSRQLQMPTFVAGKITTQVTTHHGNYILLGTTRPDEADNPSPKNAIRLWFARSDVGIPEN